MKSIMNFIMSMRVFRQIIEGLAHSPESHISNKAFYEEAERKLYGK